MQINSLGPDICRLHKNLLLPQNAKLADRPVSAQIAFAPFFCSTLIDYIKNVNLIPKQRLYHFFSKL